MGIRTSALHPVGADGGKGRRHISKKNSQSTAKWLENILVGIFFIFGLDVVCGDTNSSKRGAIDRITNSRPDEPLVTLGTRTVMLSASLCPRLPSCSPFPVIPGAPDGATVLSLCLSLQLSWLLAQGSEPSGCGSMSLGPRGPRLRCHTGVMSQTDGDAWGCLHLATMATHRAYLLQVSGGDCHLQGRTRWGRTRPWSFGCQAH